MGSHEVKPRGAKMSTRRFVVIVGLAIGLGAALLALRRAMDSVALEVAGAACVLSVFALRERWLWAGKVRQLLLAGALSAVTRAHLGI
jgi:hypothetical protein